MASLVLYQHDASPPSAAVKMVGEILGLEFQLKQPDFLSLEHKSPEYKKLNPIGTIPFLKDGDFVLAESHAIMKYLLNVYGGKHRETLYPSDPRAQAIVDQRMFFDTGVMFTRYKVVSLPSIMEGLKGPSERQLRDISEAYSVVEAYLSERRYVAADHITIADFSLGTTVSASQPILKLDVVKYPRTVAWLQKLNEHPVFNKYNTATITLFTQILHACWEKNNKDE